VALAVVTKKTPHPCAGMTPAQRRDFERVAINQRPLGGVSVIKALTERGLIEETEPKVLGRDAFGPITVRQWVVPVWHHAQWCKWASEQPDNDHE
jgi:hypothetical protein